MRCLLGGFFLSFRLGFPKLPGQAYLLVEQQLEGSSGRLAGDSMLVLGQYLSFLRTASSPLPLLGAVTQTIHVQGQKR